MIFSFIAGAVLLIIPICFSYIDSVLPKLPVLELRLPGANLDEHNAEPLIELLQRMKILRALYIIATLITQNLYAALIAACEQLLYFQYVSEVPSKSNQIHYMVMSRPSKRLIIAIANAIPMTIPAGIDAVDVIVSGSDDMNTFGSVLVNYARKTGFSVTSITVSVRPDCKTAELRKVIAVFFARGVPKWTKLRTLHEIKLNTAGCIVDISQPKDLTDQTEIRVTINDVEYIPEQWNCPKRCYFVVTYSVKFRVNESGIEFGRLAPVAQIQAVHFKCPRGLSLFFGKLAVQLTEMENIFTGLVDLSGLVDVELELSQIPYVNLGFLRSLRTIFVQQQNQPFEGVDASMCQAASSERVSIGPKGLCFRTRRAQE